MKPIENSPVNEWNHPDPIPERQNADYLHHALTEFTLATDANNPVIRETATREESFEQTQIP